MGLPIGFPLYFDGKYNVSLSFPPINPVPSKVLQVIGVTASPPPLLVPNIDYLKAFIKGDLGIATKTMQETLFKNFNHPAASNNPKVFKAFSKVSGSEIDDVEKYKVNGKLKMPKSNVQVPKMEGVGFAAFEKSLLTSIFETQKPYIDIAKIIISTVAKCEDIVARVMPLLSASPLTTRSAKPIGNAGNASRPKALGYENGVELKKALGKLSGIANKGGSVTVTKDGKAERKVPNTGSTASVGGGPGPDQTSDGTKIWEVVSTVYSTGVFIPQLEYKYTYIDLPDDTEPIDQSVDFDLNDNGDPFDAFKPKNIIFGIFDSKGVPLDPNTKLKSIGNGDNFQLEQTNFSKASWILDSPKWFFPAGNYTWKTFGTPTYIWAGEGTLFGQEKESKNKPDDQKNPINGDVIGSWSIKQYKKGVPPLKKNIINGQEAIKGDPVISKFDAVEETEYTNFFTDLVKFKMHFAEGLEQPDKNQYSSQILSQLNVRSHLENTFLYGQSKSSVYKEIPGVNIPEGNPFPNIMRLSLKPSQIFSAAAAADPKMQAYAKAYGKQPGYIWIDPEMDYETKIIRVDPTTKISLAGPNGGPEIQAEIKSFIKNINILQLSDGGTFSVRVQRKVENSYVDYDVAENTTSYVLENWNFVDNDGIKTTTPGPLSGTFQKGSQDSNAAEKFGAVNAAPEQKNTISYKIYVWGNTPGPKYRNKNYYFWKYSTDPANSYHEIIKESGTWKYRKFSFDLSATADYAFSKFRDKLETNQSNSIEIDDLYTKFLNDTEAKQEFQFSSSTSLGTVSKKSNFEVKNATSGTVSFWGDQVNKLKHSSEYVIKQYPSPSDGSSPLTASLKVLGEPILIYDSDKKVNFTHIKVKMTTDLGQKKFNFGNETTTGVGLFAIKYKLPIKDLFSKKQNITLNGNFRIEDKSLIEVKDGVITKWYYMTPEVDTSTAQNFSNLKLWYNNGVFDESGNNKLSKNKKKTFKIDVNTIGNNNSYTTINTQEENLPKFQIKVTDVNSPSGRIIDPSQIQNNDLKKAELFSTGKYGHGSSENPQTIEVITRHMLTDLDTESYYIIEGVKPDSNKGTAEAAAGAAGGGDYRLPHAIGAIRVFLSMLVDVFAKLVPQIMNLIKLLKNPAEFVTGILKEKVGQSFTIFSEQSLKTFESAVKVAKEGKAGVSGKDLTSNITGQTGPQSDPVSSQAGGIQTPNLPNGSAGGAPATPTLEGIKPKPSKQVKQLQNIFKQSPLWNHVFVDSKGRMKFLLDGVAMLPFEIFGVKIPFGLDINFANIAIPKPPIKLIFTGEQSNTGNIQDFLKGSVKDFKNNGTAAPISVSDLKPPQTKLDFTYPKSVKNPNDTKQYEIIDIKYSTGEFINGIDYKFIYIDLESEKLLKDVDNLIANNPNASDAQVLLDKLEDAIRKQPDNDALKNKRNELLSKQNGMNDNIQPLFKMLLGLVTTPLGIIAGKLQWLLDFFKSLANPVTLPAKMVELLSFSWVLNFFTPKGLLKVAGIEFNPEVIPPWLLASKVPNPVKPDPATLGLDKMIDKPQNLKYPDAKSLGKFAVPDNMDLADFDKFLKAPFIYKLPTYTSRQFRERPGRPWNLFWPFICLFEKLINGFIDFIWSLLGIEALIPPPHIKLCSKTDDPYQMSAEEVAKILSADKPEKLPEFEIIDNQVVFKDPPYTETSGDSTDAFIYDITLSDGRVVSGIDYESVQKFMDENKDINYNFQF